MTSPLLEPALFHIGPVPIPASLCTSVGITVVLGAGSFILSRLLRPEPGKVQAMCEVVITTILEQIEEVTRKDGRPYLPLIGTLFLFLIVANSLSLIPGLQPPTERLETVIALSLTVFVSVLLRHPSARAVFPSETLFSANAAAVSDPCVVGTDADVSLSMRLFGNIMSHGLILAVIVSVAALLVPIPILLFGLFTGAVQAYIFTILATVYIAAAVEDHPQAVKTGHKE